MTNNHNLTAAINTNKGTININLFAQDAPITVANFTNLAQRGFYDGLAFHRVIDDFMIQGGCPQGTGTGGPGYQFADECVANLQHDKPGVLSMANSGSGTNGSQFFITHIATPWLDMKHTIFGAVASEQDQAVVNQISQDDKITSLQINGDLAALNLAMSKQLVAWNTSLDQEFTHLKPANL
jgi:peptidyl-prolyl cis-trans isomerase B (cyclophilin B)